MALTPEEIAQSETATLVVQSDLTDVTETGRASALVEADAWQNAAIQQQIDALLRSFGFDAEGTALDDRCAQLPGFTPRLGLSPAQGAVLAMTRSTSSGALTVPAGSTFQTPSGAIFVLTADVTFLDGSTAYPSAGQPYGYVVCSAPGTTGNVGAGAITIVRSGPDDVIGCTNPTALSNGQPRETDAQLRKRALDYVAGGLTQLTPDGLRSFVLSFVSSDGTRSRNAPAIWTDPARPYAEVIPDDGTGFAGLTRDAIITSGAVPANGQSLFWFESPRVSSEVALYVNASLVGTVQWTTIAERGVAYLDDAAAFWSPGDTWSVEGGQVYIGYLAELQRAIDGTLTYLGLTVGRRATATRVRVVAPTRELVSYDVLAVYNPGFDPADVNTQIRDAILQWHLDLNIGQPLLVSHLIGALDTIVGLANFSLRDIDDPTIAMSDVYPSTDRVKLYTLASAIQVNGAV